MLQTILGDFYSACFSIQEGFGSNSSYRDAEKKVEAVLNDLATPTQCLADHNREIAARAVESILSNLTSYSIMNTYAVCIEDIDEYANKIRAGEVDYE